MSPAARSGSLDSTLSGSCKTHDLIQARVPKEENRSDQPSLLETVKGERCPIVWKQQW